MTGTRTLFDIGADMLAVNAMLERAEETGVSLESLDFAALADANLSVMLLTEEAAKLDNYVGLVRQLEMEEAAAAAEAEQWQKKAESRRKRVKWLKDRMLAHMVATGRDRVETAAGRTIRVQDNGGAVPVEMTDGEILLPSFLKMKYEPDKEKIRKALEAGEVLNFARLGERGRHLRIG